MKIKNNKKDIYINFKTPYDEIIDETTIKDIDIFFIKVASHPIFNKYKEDNIYVIIASTIFNNQRIISLFKSRTKKILDIKNVYNELADEVNSKICEYKTIQKIDHHYKLDDDSPYINIYKHF